MPGYIQSIPSQNWFYWSYPRNYPGTKPDYVGHTHVSTRVPNLDNISHTRVNTRVPNLVILVVSSKYPGTKPCYIGHTRVNTRVHPEYIPFPNPVILAMSEQIPVYQVHLECIPVYQTRLYWPYPGKYPGTRPGYIGHDRVNTRVHPECIPY